MVTKRLDPGDRRNSNITRLNLKFGQYTCYSKQFTSITDYNKPSATWWQLVVLQVRSCGSVGVDGFVGRAVGAFVGRSVFRVVVLYQWCGGGVVIKVSRAVGGFVGRSVVGVVVLYQWCGGDVVIKVVELVDSPRSIKIL